MIVLSVIVTPIEYVWKNCRMQSIYNVNQLDCNILHTSIAIGQKKREKKICLWDRRTDCMLRLEWLFSLYAEIQRRFLLWPQLYEKVVMSDHSLGHTDMVLRSWWSFCWRLMLQRRMQAMEMRCYREILRISYKDHVTNEVVRARIQQANGHMKTWRS